MRLRTTLCSSLLLLAGASGAAGALGCGGKTAGETVRPKDPTYEQAAGGDTSATCTKVGDEGKPLVVDWNPAERSDLEAALKKRTDGGVVVVHYDCKGIQLLQDCKVDGTYGYIGTTAQEQVISLNNADEVKAISR